MPSSFFCPSSREEGGGEEGGEEHSDIPDFFRPGPSLSAPPFPPLLGGMASDVSYWRKKRGPGRPGCGGRDGEAAPPLPGVSCAPLPAVRQRKAPKTGGERGRRATAAHNAFSGARVHPTAHTFTLPFLQRPFFGPSVFVQQWPGTAVLQL